MLGLWIFCAILWVMLGEAVRMMTVVSAFARGGHAELIKLSRIPAMMFLVLGPLLMLYIIFRK